MKRKCRKQWRRWIRLFILPLLFFVGGITNTFAQSGIKITGKVIDASKMEVIGANVMVKGTSVGVITDLNGEYTITVPDEKSVLVFSFVGYRSQEQIVGKKERLISCLKMTRKHWMKWWSSHTEHNPKQR